MKWKSVKLGTLCKLVNGKAFKPSDWSEDGIRIVRIQNLNDPTKDYNHWPGPLDKQVLINTGDLLLAWSGTPGTSFGAHIWNNGKAILNQHIFRVDLHDGVIAAEWGKMCINYKLYSLIDQAHGGVGLQHVTKPMVESLDILVPPLPIQKQLAAILQKADAAREKRRQANQLTEQFLQSAFLEMFGDPVTNPRGWDRSSMEQVCSKVADGTHFSPPPQKAGIPYITAKHIKKHGMDFDSDPTYVAEERHREIYKRCDPIPGDVIYIKDGVTTGIAAVNRYDFQFSLLSSLALLRPTPGILKAEYLSAYLNAPSAKSVILRQMAGGAIKRLTVAKIKRLTVIVPPFAMQEKFALVVRKVESLRAKQKESQKELENLFNSLMQRAFRGELV